MKRSRSLSLSRDEDEPASKRLRLTFWQELIKDCLEDVKILSLPPVICELIASMTDDCFDSAEEFHSMIGPYISKATLRPSWDIEEDELETVSNQNIVKDTEDVNPPEGNFTFDSIFFCSFKIV